MPSTGEKPHVCWVCGTEFRGEWMVHIGTTKHREAINRKMVRPSKTPRKKT